MASRDVPRPEPAGTQARLKKDLDDAEAAVGKILASAPLAIHKYKDTARAGRAVVEALTYALRDHAEASSRYLRYKREHG